MAKFLFPLFFVVVILLGILMIQYGRETYRYLPINVEKVPEVMPHEGWREFVSAIGRFKVMLPITPQHANEKLPVPGTAYFLDYDMYISETPDGTTYMISLIRYPDALDTSNTDNMLENVMNEMVAASPGNKLRQMAFGEFLGVKALDFTIHSPEIVVASKAFVVGKTLYLLTLIDKMKKYKEEDFKYFVESFGLVPETETMPSK